MKTRTLFLLILMAILARDIYRNCQLGITDKKTLSKMAHRNDLGGLKAFMLRGSGSPWLIDITDLAQVLDEKSR